MNAAQAQRLLEEQTLALQQTEQRAEQLTKFRDDYTALQDRLKTLPDKLTHDIMVPFGKLAFMPGQLVHTNEVTVLLGDNWFVDRSAKQACKIIDRRVTAIDDQLGELEKQKGLLQPRREFTEDLYDRSGEREIREEYNEQRERQWKVKHRENMKKYKLQQREEEKRRAAKAEKKQPLTDDDLWSRLDELEELELKHREMEKLDDELRDGPQETQELPRQEERESDDDDYDDDDLTEDSDDYEDDDDDDNGATRRPTSIRFSHTKTAGPQSGVATSNPPSDQPAPGPITSPADIYARFSPLQGPRSILKSPGSASSTNQRVTITEPEGGTAKGPQDRPARPQPVSVGQMAFTGSIVEKQDTTPVEAPSQQAAPPRVSKFKAQRMKQQNR